MRSAENLKLFETLFNLQTDSCSTDKITPPFAASLNENNGAHSKLKIHTPFMIKFRELDWKQLTQNLDALLTLKKMKKNNFHDDCQVLKKDRFIRAKTEIGHTFFTLTRQRAVDLIKVERRTNNRQRTLSAAYLLKRVGISIKKYLNWGLYKVRSWRFQQFFLSNVSASRS